MAEQDIEIEIQAHSVDWASVLAGTAGAVAISFLLTGFGTALGLSLTSAHQFAGVSGTTFAVVVGVWFALVHIASFYFGGYVTGRMRRPISLQADERNFRDGMHGFLVWAVGTLVGAFLLASTVGAISSKAVDAAGQAVQAGGQAASQIATRAATSPDARGAVESTLTYYADRLFRPAGVPNATAQATPAPQDRPTAAAEAGRILAVSLYNDRLDPNDRTYVAGLVATQAGLSQEDAGKRVDEVFAAAQSAKNDAANKARETAEAARRTGVLSAFLIAAISLIGLVAAAAGASIGGMNRDEGKVPAVLGASRLW